MIKYLGSKRRLVPVLGVLAEATGARTAVDLFTGTTRVAQEFKRRGINVTTVDLATYSQVLAESFIATDSRTVDHNELARLITELNALPGKSGYFTQTFCQESRFFQEKNGQRIDAIRDYLDTELAHHPLRRILLATLLLAADKIDSTTGQQMAYLKQWSPRSHTDLNLLVPTLLPGPGAAIQGDAVEVAATLPEVDLAYLDPPYNQHRYFTNYHVWETLMRWDQPEFYGVACKRVDSREEENFSVFNRRKTMPDALTSVIANTAAKTMVVSYNDESWVSPEEITHQLTQRYESVATLDFNSQRYVGARIGIFNQQGEKVGRISHTRNIEHIFIAGSNEVVERTVNAVTSGMWSHT